MKFPLIIHLDKFEITDYWRGRLRQAVRDAGKPIRAEGSTLLPESRKMRGYVMGGLIKLCVYLDGNDYKNSETCERYFEFLKTELTPEMLVIKGKSVKFGKSSKGSKALAEFIEKLLEYLNEQYGVAYDSLAINPDEYKKFRDEMYILGEYEDWIDYLVKNKLL